MVGNRQNNVDDTHTHGQKARRTAVLSLTRRYPTFTGHSAQVARLARGLFDQIVGDKAHSLEHIRTDLHREWLEYAALLHDIGYIVEARRHHRHSERLIRDANLHGFTPGDINTIALAARFHRKRWREYGNKAFRGAGRVEYETVRVLAAILRVADGLDRTHRHVVQNIDVVRTPVALELSVYATVSPDDEIWAAMKKGDLLAEVVGLPLVIRPMAHNE
jgi:exopolyphosphatase / guanosine-5'-triphosphate,3'-diphosphate pyrophosphatase